MPPLRSRSIPSGPRSRSQSRTFISGLSSSQSPLSVRIISSCLQASASPSSQAMPNLSRFMSSLARSSPRASSEGSRSSLSAELDPPSSPSAPAPSITEANSRKPTVSVALVVVSAVVLDISSMKHALVFVISMDSEYVHVSLNVLSL